MDFGESGLRAAVEILVRLVEAAGALVIFAGAATAAGRVALHAVTRRGLDFANIRLRLGRTLVLGLEFLLAADLLRTAVAPTFEEIGMLAAVATIRTALNFFLQSEMREARLQLDSGSEPAGAAAPP